MDKTSSLSNFPLFSLSQRKTIGLASLRPFLLCLCFPPPLPRKKNMPIPPNTITIRRPEDIIESIDADAMFRNFFRAPLSAFQSKGDESSSSSCLSASLTIATLDRLSLLACERQGIHPLDELLPMNQDSFRGRNVPQLTEEVRAEQFETRRIQKLRLLEIERKRIIGILMSIHKSFYDDSLSSSAAGRRGGRHIISAEQQLLVTELIAQADEHAKSPNRRLYRMAFLVPDERSVAVPLLSRQAVNSSAAQEASEQAVKRIQEQGAKELEKLRQRELRAVEREIDTELVKTEMLAELQRKEAELRLQKQRRREQAAKKALEQEIVRQSKMEHVTEQQSKLMRERMEELEARCRMREEHLRDLERKKELEADERCRAEAKAQAEARERARLLREDHEAQRMLLESEVLSRMALHSQRKANMEVRMNTVREMRRLEDRRKFAMVSEFLASSSASHEELAAELAKNDAEAKLRLAEREARQKELLEQHRFNNKEQIELAQQRRSEVDAERGDRASVLMLTLSEQERHVKEVAQAKEAERSLRAELARQRERNISENLGRLDKTYEYRHKMKQLRLEQEKMRTEAQIAAKRELESSLGRSRVKMARDREQLLEQVAKLSASPSFLRITENSTSSGGGGDAAPLDRTAVRQSIVQKLQQSLLDSRQQQKSRPASSPGRVAGSSSQLAITDRPSSSPHQRGTSAAAIATHHAATEEGFDRTTPVTLVTALTRPASAA